MLYRPGYIHQALALAIFTFASLTDYWDGEWARRRQQITTFGEFMDPLADKLLVAAALLAFVNRPDTLIPVWMVFLILAREFMITAIRYASLAQGRPIRTSHLGKAKTTSQMTTIHVILILIVIRRYIEETGARNIQGVDLRIENFWEMVVGDFWGVVIKYAPYGLMLITTVLTVISGARYVVQNRHIITGKLPRM